MAQCSPQSLLTDASCYQCLSPGELQLANTVLLAKILTALNPMAATDFQSILNEAACFECLTPWQLALVQTQLLCTIATGGGNASACLTCGSGAPVTPSTCSCALYYDSDKTSPTAGHFWFWSVSDNQWIAFA
jgi:hypothetical protein